MATSTASSSKLSARRLSAVLGAMLVWSCASLAAAEAPKSTSLTVSVRVAGSCDIRNGEAPSASCVGTMNPMLDTSSMVFANERGEKLEVPVTTMNF